jgi:nucleoside 2-deoxyribosyltransferase
MKIYLAVAWARREEIRKIAEELNKITNVYVNSHWIYETKSLTGKDSFKLRQEQARVDVMDVKKADVLVRFTDNLNRKFVPAKLATGARMFEMGYAYATGKKIIVVGGHQPIFDYLPGIIHVNDLATLKELLSVEAKRRIN